MSKACGISQQRLQVTHYGYDRACLAVTLLSVSDCHQVVHHLVNVATILRKIEFSSCVVVILFHKNWFGLQSRRVLRLQQEAHARKSSVARHKPFRIKKGIAT
jgi:hypothetical protein